MRVVIFVGHHKVGSSALQQHLGAVAPALVRQGLLYPAVTQRDFEALQSAVKSGATTQKPVRNVAEAHNALAFSMLADETGGTVPGFHENLPPTAEMFSLIREQIALFQPDTLVLAAEVFANFAAVNPDLIRTLYSELGLIASDDIEIFTYLRRIDEYLVSWHGQRVRFGQKIRALPGKALANYIKGIHFDYRLMIEAWQTARPGTGFVLRPYDNVVKRDGSVAIFASAMGLDLPPVEKSANTVNQSIHRAVLDFARQANFDLEDHEKPKFFNAMLRVSTQLDVTPPAQIEMFGLTARIMMYDRFAPINDWLSNLHGAPLFEDLDKVKEMRPIDEAYANIDALAHIKSSLMHEFTKPEKAFVLQLAVSRNFAARRG
jgi:hypothetical protein